MIKINPAHLDKFKKIGRTYMYYISPGLFLSFDINSLEYKEPVDYIVRYKSNVSEIEATINKLIAIDVLEII